jgi:hypothetical protein
MNIFSGLLSGEKRPRSDSPPPPDDPWDEKILTVIHKFLPHLVTKITDELGDKVRDTIQAAVTTPMEPIRQEIGVLGGKVVTLEEKVATLSTSLDELVSTTVETAVAARVGAVEETVRATFEAFENSVHDCTLSIDALERKLRSPNSLLFGVEESVGEHTLAAVKSLLGAGSIKEAFRLGKKSATANRPRPVLIKFDSLAAKHAAFKHAKELRRQFKVSIDDDLTPMQQAARATRLPEVQQLRGEGWTTFWRGDTLFKVKAGGAPLKVPLPVAPASRRRSSPATGPGPSSSSRAEGPSHPSV